jgi:hypothetical protein
MKSHALAALIFLSAALCCAGQSGDVDEAHVVRYARAIDVATLDPTLPSMPLDKWLTSGPPHLKEALWERGDCDLKPAGPEPKDGWPLCVKVRIRKGEVRGWLSITIGTTRSGIIGPPRFAYATLISKQTGVADHFRTVKRLSELPEEISKLERDNRSLNH